MQGDTQNFYICILIIGIFHFIIFNTSILLVFLHEKNTHVTCCFTNIFYGRGIF